MEIFLHSSCRERDASLSHFSKKRVFNPRNTSDTPSLIHFLLFFFFENFFFNNPPFESTLLRVSARSRPFDSVDAQRRPQSSASMPKNLLPSSSRVFAFQRVPSLTPLLLRPFLSFSFSSVAKKYLRDDN